MRFLSGIMFSAADAPPVPTARSSYARAATYYSPSHLQMFLGDLTHESYAIGFARLLCRITLQQRLLRRTAAHCELRSPREAQDTKAPGNGKIVAAPGGVTLDVTGGPFEFKPDAVAVHGDASASVFATVRAQQLDLGIGIEGSILSTGGPIAGGIITGASGGRIHATATAGWIEFMVPKVRNASLGDKFIYTARILLDGSFGPTSRVGSTTCLARSAPILSSTKTAPMQCCHLRPSH